MIYSLAHCPVFGVHRNQKEINNFWSDHSDEILARELFLLLELFKEKKVKSGVNLLINERLCCVDLGANKPKHKRLLAFKKSMSKQQKIYDSHKQFYIDLYNKYPRLKPNFKEFLEKYNITVLNAYKNLFLPHIKPYIENRHIMSRLERYGYDPNFNESCY